MTTYTKAKTGGDFLLHHESQQANLFSAHVKAPASGGPHTVAQIAGMPCIYTESTQEALLLLVAAQATATAFLISGPPINAIADGATTAEEYLVAKGPGCVANENVIPGTDSVGGSYTLATITGGSGLSDWVFRSEPTKTEVQDNDES